MAGQNHTKRGDMRPPVITNAFSLTMLPEGGTVRAELITASEAISIMCSGGCNCCGFGGGDPAMGCNCRSGVPTVDSAVGHEGTAEVFSRLLGLNVQANRRMLTLEPGDVIVVGQIGQRLPEGRVLSAEELQDMEIRWMRVCRVS